MQHRLWPLIGLTLISFLPVAGLTALIAQPLPQYSPRQQTQQLALKNVIDREQTANYSQALLIAQRLNRPIEQRRTDGTVLMLRGVSSRGELLYDATYSATRAAQTTRTSSLYTGGSLGLSLSGSTLVDKLGIWDGGKVRNTHVEFRNGAVSRVTQADNAGTFDSHASHVSGIMMAAGVNASVRGMAFGTTLRAYDFNRDVTEMSAAAPNLLVSNHSYGSQAGWILSDRTTTTRWEWWGDTTISQTEDYKFGLYDDKSRSWDQIVQNAPYYLIVKSAGNNHGDNGPGAGQPYYLGTSNSISRVPRNDQTGYDQVPTYGTAKNILTVGAIGNLNYGYNQPADVSLGGFSSWGPTDDGRIKPDLVGVGVSVLSSSADTDSSYVTYSGTSMSSPNVAGSLFLLQELFSQRNGGRFLRASTLKGLAIHTADEAGDAPGPDYRNGWGLLNTEAAARVLLNSDRNYLLDERTLTQGETYTQTVVASGRGPLRVTICWTDPAGTATSALNDRTPRLVNDLDVRVSDGAATALPWILDPANPANPATPGDNIRDNVEQVLITNPVPGKSYTLTITHKGTLGDGKQDYALLASGIGGNPYCVSRASSTADTKISRVQFGSINQAGADGCTAYTDFSSVTATVQASQPIPLTVSLGSCGGVKNAVVKAFIDWNQNGSFDDPGETVATSGVLPNTAQFVSTITVPATVQNGQRLRLRLVATETDNAAAVNACGEYGNGETQDYVLTVVQTTNDVGSAALVSPEASFCGQTNQEVTVAVRLRNYGSADQRNVPVSVRITDAANAEIAVLTGTVTLIQAFRESLLTLKTPAVVKLTAGQAYRFTVTTSLNADQNPANNTVTEVRTTALAPATGLFAATRCGSDTVLSLRNTGGGTAFWYDAPAGGNLLAAGNRIAVKAPPAGGQLYVVLNEFSGTLGPVDKRSFGGGSYAGNFGPAPLITTQVPLLIESARLYIASAGQLTFTVRKFDNTAISSVTVDVAPTRNPSLTATVNGQLVDDPDDAGAVYALNLRIPQTGTYKITLDYAGGASIFRSNSAVSGFPYQLTTQTGQPVVSSRGALFNRTATQTDTITNSWYYLYDIRVRSLDCPSLERIAVMPVAGTAATAMVTPNGSASICQGASLTLQANTGADLSYQWLRDGQTLTGAVSSTLQAAASGSYAVQVANTCSPVQSAPVVVMVRSAQMPVVTTDGLLLSSNVMGNSQWLLNGIPIPGATNPSLTAAQSGRYSVRGSVNGCGELISDEVTLAILANEPEPETDQLLVYPNPATRQITISLETGVSPPRNTTVRLTDLRGLTLRRATLQRDGKNQSAVLDINDLPGGTFFVVISDDQGQTVRVKRVYKP